MARPACAHEVANSECVWTMPPICGKFAVEQRVRVEIARWAQRAFDDFAIEIGDHQVGGRQRGVIHAAGLDDDERLRARAVDSAGVAEGVRRKAAAGDLLVGMKDLFAK